MTFDISQQLLRLVCRLDEENICQSHTEMPDCYDTDRENKIESDAELDGMIEGMDLDELGFSSDVTETTIDDTSSSEYWLMKLTAYLLFSKWFLQ